MIILTNPSLPLAFYPLVIADVANRHQDVGLTVVPNNCDRFLVSKKSSQLSTQKISRHIQSLTIDISQEFRENFLDRMNLLGLRWIDVLRGHFLISASFHFIKKYVAELRSAVSISREMLFGSLMLAFEKSFDPNHSHYNYYQTIFDEDG
ncbi:hypothetical protein [Sodalinema gerasimenkoae]|uniref:hypothetical protein n=1 Tax=Sodalinema gerasimenkoae TaxID=2862348 RepID=UPI001CA47A89|nr:hypothetical protein [Sodalinema gerasimenkoae]